MNRAQVVVVGAGPAGLGAAIECARHGASVAVFDENQRPGGQLVIGEILKKEAISLGVGIYPDTPVWGVFKGNRVGTYSPQGSVSEWAFERLVIATGGLENPLAFPGWSLPGIMGAGACQTLMNVHGLLPGKRGLMVGSGNVGLIVTYQLLQAGAHEVTIIEAAPRVGGYAVHAGKIRRAGVPICTNHTIKRAEGAGSVERALIVEIDDRWQEVSGSEKWIDVDLVCLSVGLSPLAELAKMAGCQMGFVPQLGGYVPLHNDDMETTVPGVYVAGDIAGIEEASTALDEGRLAGISAAESLGLVPPDEASVLKAGVNARLRHLRSGPFGMDRSAGKVDLVDAWSRTGKSHFGA